MFKNHLMVLVCPVCYGALDILMGEETKLHILTGNLACPVCHTNYPIVRGIPRFVSGQNYADNFGLEWTLHARTQYDSYSGLNMSGKRFFDETHWSRNLSGQTILEVGSGSGRFTEQAASTDAMVVSMDFSEAVDANYQSNYDKPNVLIVQGDIYRMPFRKGFFDKLFCFGVLQHTPDVHKAFLALPAMLKPGGDLVVDVYKKTFLATTLQTKYYVRPFTRNMTSKQLYKFVVRWVDALWPLACMIRKIPRVGHSINWRLLVADYSHLGVPENLLKEWAYLDTFDMLSPRYDFPQTLSVMRKWFDEAELEGIEVHFGYNGIEGRGRKPAV